ncbi:JAB domain-containing protein [Candidatus Cardinium hertigii]|uniref:JAB domain-containing protein n=1 Tax=Candidatus Cardinium hertigii TaxID=247481 RepID=UPI003D7C6229
MDNKDISYKKVRDPYDVYGLMHMLLNLKDKPDLTKENFWTVSLDIDRMILNVELVSMCSYLDTASIPSEVFNMPLQKKAYGIVLVHNSPTGVLDPREEDIDLTDRLIQVGNIICIAILDHLIITEKSYYSFQGSGLMDEIRLSKRYSIPSLEIGASVKKQVATKRRKNDKSHLIDQYIEEEINQIK